MDVDGWESLGALRPNGNRFFRWWSKGREPFLIKVYGGPEADQRCQREADRLEAWHGAGWRVPALVPKEAIPDPPEPGPWNAMRWLAEARSLQDILEYGEKGREAKRSLLHALFSEQADRLHSAVETDDPHFIHGDPNSGNFVLSRGLWYALDFEAGSKASSSVLHLASLEVAKLSRWAARDLGGGRQTRLVLETLAEAHGERDAILRQVASNTLGRSLQWYHRRKDQRRRRDDPGEVTKYAIADGLRELGF